MLTNENANDGLTFKAHRSEGAALLAFDVDPDLRDELAGFAVRYLTPEGKEWPITNRLTFEAPITSETTPAQRIAITTPTDKAPLQKFRWVHFPRRVPPGTFAYTATAMLFKAGTETVIEPGPSTTVELDLKEDSHADFELGFTRGYLSSQAYAELFENAPIEPDPASFDFDTTEFVDQYRWLGFRGREMIFGILDEAIEDVDARLDVFAYDLDEPDVIRKLQALGARLRIFLDDSESHDEPDPEKEAPPRSAPGPRSRPPRAPGTSRPATSGLSPTTRHSSFAAATAVARSYRAQRTSRSGVYMPSRITSSSSTTPARARMLRTSMRPSSRPPGPILRRSATQSSPRSGTT